MTHTRTMHSDESPHNVRHHVQLPSGKRIEVVYLDNPLPPSLGAGRRRSEPATEPLHVCFYCAGELVHPVDWAEAGPGQWRILLRCPECEATREGVFEQTAVERLDDELDRAAEALLNDLQRVTHANMAEEIDLFTRALDADLIQPCDF
jgi:nucleotide-binding universal stress UspA family protein